MSRERCQRVMRESGKAYPRTCLECGLAGPCKYPPSPQSEVSETIAWTEREREAIAQLMRDQDLSYSALIRCCLRHYQSDHMKRKDGETVAWSGDAKRAAEFAGMAHNPKETK